MENYEKLVGMSKMDARKAYLNYLKNFKLYMAQFFLVKVG